MGNQNRGQTAFCKGEGALEMEREGEMGHRQNGDVSRMAPFPVLGVSNPPGLLFLILLKGTLKDFLTPQGCVGSKLPHGCAR